MIRRPVIVSALVVIGLGALTPAIAATDHFPGDPGTLVAQPRVAPEMFAAMQRDLALNDDQANARLRREAWATRTSGGLRSTLGDRYAGSWLNADAGELNVAVTDQAAAARVRAAGARPRLVSRGARTLDDLVRRLDAVARTAPGAVTSWHVDVAANSIVLTARPGAEATARQVVAASGAPADAVRVVASAESPRPFADVRGGDAFFVNQAARCSVGFSVVGGFVTAGHCGRAGATTNGFDQTPQGTFRASSFPGNDFAVVTVNDDWTPVGVVNTRNGLVAVAGSQEAPVGASVCRTGSTTGTRCGVIEARNATVNYAEGSVPGLTRTSACAEGGDSGGPFLAGNQAQGVTSGGSGDCRTGGITFFQPVNEILAANRLTLVTSAEPRSAPVSQPVDGGDRTGAAGGAGADQPEQASCAGVGVGLRGSLDRTGAQQLQPADGAFRAAAGNHVACLDAPDGATFTLVLQRWSGLRWENVATGTTAGQLTLLSFSGAAGTFRYRVASRQGAGAYQLGAAAP